MAFIAGTAAAKRSCTISRTAGSISRPMLWRSEAMAARVVVPVPRNGSSTVSCFTENMFASQ